MDMDVLAAYGTSASDNTSTGFTSTKQFCPTSTSLTVGLQSFYDACRQQSFRDLEQQQKQRQQQQQQQEGEADDDVDDDEGDGIENFIDFASKQGNRLLNHRYKILKQIGSGAFSELYMAIDTYE